MNSSELSPEAKANSLKQLNALLGNKDKKAEANRKNGESAICNILKLVNKDKK